MTEDKELRLEMTGLHGNMMFLVYPRVLYLDHFYSALIQMTWYNIIKECNIYNYADDNNISYNNSDLKKVVEALEVERKNILEWFKVNYLVANPNPTVWFLVPNRVGFLPEETYFFQGQWKNVEETVI